MHHPFQVVAAVSSDPSYLIAASGSSLLSVNLKDGTIAAQWQPETVTQHDRPLPNKPKINLEEPPSKRRKVDSISDLPNIIDVSVTPDQTHIVVVTGEDKCIRVFSISSEGLLLQLNQRYMSKRPSAIALSPDGQTIFSADKFGDVYTLPLLPTLEEDEAAREAAKKHSKQWTPAATELTVHSQANLRSLQNQLKKVQENNQVKTKEPLAFAHSLILGHVSMLTDIVVAKSSADGDHHFVITADRDEHIRVSRGIPQSYLIEGFCLGHKEFVNKLCLIHEDILLSAGGDDEVYMWNWPEMRLISKIPIRDAVIRALNESIPIEEPLRIAITGLWHIPKFFKASRIFVSCEGVPALLHFEVPSDATQAFTDVEILPLSRNVLDLAVFEDYMIVSVDNVHMPGSTLNIDESTAFKSRLLAISMDPKNETTAEHVNRCLVETNELTIEEWHEKALRNLLYSTEALRKHRSEEESGEPHNQVE